jgi:hypothetical protein
LRAAADGVWVDLEGPIGGHDHARVCDAAEAMASDGLLELEIDPLRARLPLA